MLTIDPAKRLADSLGLKELGNEPRPVDPELFERGGIEMKGELWAMMLDAKATFDELVRKHAPDAETRDRILENRIYQQLSTALAGSQEYMAMEKLFELHAEGRYDLLVLDTPPSRNALDFLDAPKRLTQFIEGRGMQMFMKPTGFGDARSSAAAARWCSRVLKRVTGVDLIADLREFFQAFSGMVDGFRERAKRVNELLADPRPPSWSSAAPRASRSMRPSTSTASWSRRSCPSAGVIVNKVHYESERREDGDGARRARRGARRRRSGRARRCRTSTTTGRWRRATRRNIERLTASCARER